ncbi:MAG: HAD-IA family hydrolase [Alphaproteobacteria bacterium]
MNAVGKGGVGQRAAEQSVVGGEPAGALAVIFDCDGVLVDSEVVACGVAATVLQRHGVSIDAATVMQRFLGRPLTYLIGELSREHAVDLQTGFLPEMRAAVLAAMQSGVAPIPGMAALLRRLALRKCVASSSEMARVRAALTSSGLIEHFGEHIYTAEQVARPKPFPDLFLHGAARLGVAPERCLVVEDSKAGVCAARAAGMTPIGFAGGSHATAAMREGLAAEGAIAVVDDVEALAGLIADLAAAAG